MEVKSKKINIWVLIISIVLVFCLPFIIGSRDDGKGDFLRGIYGFPFDWLYLYTNKGFSFLIIGFIVNIVFFYFVIKILIWIYKKIVG